MHWYRTVSGTCSKAEAHGGPAGAPGPSEIGRLHSDTAHVHEHVPVIHRACKYQATLLIYQLEHSMQ